MSEIEIITDGGRRRRWPSAEKLRIVEETLDEGASISVVARRNGVAPNLLYRWRRPMLDGGAVAVTGDDDVTSNKMVRQMEDRVRELERQLGSAARAAGRLHPVGWANVRNWHKTEIPRSRPDPAPIPPRSRPDPALYDRCRLVSRHGKLAAGSRSCSGALPGSDKPPP